MTLGSSFFSFIESFLGLGKLAQETGKTEARYCINDDQVDACFNDYKLEVKNAILVSSDMIELTVAENTPYRAINLSGNLVYSALISAYGRIRLHRLFQYILKNSSATILYADTISFFIQMTIRYSNRFFS